MPEPALSVRFSVKVDDYGSLGTWSKCEGLAVEHEVQEYMEGGNNGFVHRLPGRRKYTNLKLTRTLDADSATVVKWVSSVAPGFKRTNAEVAALDPGGEVICRWNLTDVYPVKWTGPTLDAAGNQVAIEQLELAHHGFLSGS